MTRFALAAALLVIPALGLPGIALGQDLVPEDNAPLKSVPIGIDAKLRYHAQSAYGSWSLLAATATAAGMQISNGPKEWGQGAEGYRRRLGSTLAYSGLRNVIALGLDAPLHQDPRYSRSHETGLWNRAGHAIRGTLLTRKDTGGETFATWRFGSAYGATFLSNQWYPDRLNTVKLGMTQGTVQIGFDLLANLRSEFWPDVQHRLSRGRRPPIVRIDQVWSPDR